MSAVSCALGLDLGLNSGWAVVRVLGGPPEVLACGNIDVRHEDGVSARLLAWEAQLATVAAQAVDAGVSGVAYEEIRRMQGQGARWILFQEGIANVELPLAHSLPVIGVNQAALRAFAGLRPKSKSNPTPATWAMRSIDVFANPAALKTQDQAVAAFAAYWLCTVGEVR